MTVNIRSGYNATDTTPTIFDPNVTSSTSNMTDNYQLVAYVSYTPMNTKMPKIPKNKTRDYPTMKQGLRDPRIKTKWSS